MSALRAALQVDPAAGPQQLFPVIDSDRRLHAVVTRFTLQQLTERQTVDAVVNLDPIRHNAPAVAYPDEPLRWSCSAWRKLASPDFRSSIGIDRTGSSESSRSTIS